MNLISRKLRSKTGASMLIAILFMMFCLFVGGSVLAAASANGYRVAHMSDQQDFLSQRSAATLIADEIDGGKQVSMNMTVEDQTLNYQPIIILPGGGMEPDPDAPATNERTITFKALFTPDKSMTVMQRLLYETAVCRYLMEHGISEGTVGTTTTRVELEGFWYDGEKISGLGQFWYQYSPEETQIKGQLDISGKIDATNEQFTEYTAYFTSGAQEDMFDFLVSFGDYSQMTVSANAYMSTSEILRPSEIVEDPARGNVRISATTTRTYVTWDWANIRKGGEGV